MDKRMARLRVAGKGSYGIVYIATEANNIKDRSNKKDVSLRGIPEEELYAIKRLFKEKPTTGYGSLREADMMKILSGHPYIVNLIGIKHNDPFKNTARPMTPISKTDFSKLTEDKMLFVMEYLPYNGEEYILEKTCTPFAIKVLIMQLLLAIEYIHSQGVVHRDIRTSNVLVSVDSDGNHELKLCDFGLSRVMGDGKSTPGVITSWYRAPEVNCSCPYNRKADMWSAGCVIYEFICGKPLLKGTDDKDEDIFNTILSKLPSVPDQKVIEKMFVSGHKLKLQNKATSSNRMSFINRMKLSDKFKTDFESVPGSLAQLEDLLESLLCLDPDNRISATRALDHPFFEWTQDHIAQIRRDFPPEPPPLPILYNHV
jgi:serine/threonine protein kinase